MLRNLIKMRRFCANCAFLTIYTHILYIDYNVINKLCQGFLTQINKKGSVRKTNSTVSGAAVNELKPIK